MSKSSAKELLIEAAVRNNAAWVAAVHRAHGHVGETVATLWLTRGAALPFYPNAVTLAPHGAEEVIVVLRRLTAAGQTTGWGVKDSYAALDLTLLGFRRLFSATWIYRPAGAPNNADTAGLTWRRVATAAALAAWEQAWRGASADTPPPRLFLPALLDDPDIVFLAGCVGEAVVAGTIANRTGLGAQAVVGVSNLFWPVGDGERLRPGALAALSAAFPGRPLVGYDSGGEPDAMLRQGFTPLGPLQVWAR